MNIDRKPLLTPYKAEKTIMQIYPIKGKSYDICKKGCKLFSVDEYVCNFCGENRYKNPTQKIPKNTMTYLPLSSQLATFISNREIRELLQYRARRSLPENGIKTDIFDGESFQSISHLFSGELDIALSLFLDGFQPFNKSKFSMTIVHLIILNLPPFQRYVT